MKEQNWKESDELAKEFIEANGSLIEEAEFPLDAKAATPQSKSQLTELRRRIEERLDSKRIALEFEYEDFDDLDDNFQ
tara:strand:+ start:625 stop:858 length:234 start_codon:yes stop_codon:yes gene_type:complete